MVQEKTPAQTGISVSGSVKDPDNPIAEIYYSIERKRMCDPNRPIRSNLSDEILYSIDTQPERERGEKSGYTDNQCNLFGITENREGCFCFQIDTKGKSA